LRIQKIIAAGKQAIPNRLATHQHLQQIPLSFGRGARGEVDTIPERMFFSKESPPEYRTHHLNLAKLESSFWKNQRLFRDYLKENDQLASEYIQLKERFEEYYARTNHVDFEWKSAFVAKALSVFYFRIYNALHTDNA
jgi:GrpB-like predicted nucleotidyltransferase (UPF0157 family)